MSRVHVFTQFGGPEVEVLTTRPVPEPGPDELLLEVRAAGVNPVDYKIREGYLGRGWELPAPMGREVAGVVADVGAEVSEIAVGDEVLGPVADGEGGFADHARVRAADAIAKPEEISFEIAATIPVAGTTAYDLTHQIELEAGQKLLILGAGGGVGHFAAQIGVVHEFEVIGVASESKRELIESTGARFVASGASMVDAARQLAPDGVDLLVDLVGGEPLRELAALVTSPDRIVSVAGDDTATELGGSGRVADPESLEKMTDVVGYQAVTPHVSATYPLDRAREALAAVETGHTAGKVVIVP